LILRRAPAQRALPVTRPVPPARNGRGAAKRARLAPAPVSNDKAPGLTGDPFRLLMLALVIETVSKVASFLGPMAKMRPALVLFSLCFLVALANPAKAFNRDLLKWPVPRLILAQVVMACGSAAFGISLGHSALFVIEVYWKTIVFALLLMSSLRSVRDVRRTIWATALAGIILAFIAVFVTGVSKSTGVEGYDANDIGLIMVTTLPLILLLVQTSGWRGKVLSLVGLALVTETIVKSLSRGAFIGAAAVGIALLLFLPGVSLFKRLAALTAVVVTMMFYAPEGYWDTMRKVITDPKSDYNWDAPSGRRMVAKRGMQYMTSYPGFGIGINNFAMAEGTISEYARAMANTNVGVKWSAPHNSWVQAGAETGIPGLLIWAALIAGSAGGLIRLRRRMPRSWAKSSDPDERLLYLSALYIPIALFGFAVAGTFVSFAWSDQSYILPALAMGVQIAFLDKMQTAGRRTAAPASPEAVARRPLRLRPA
jgi:hypothetical protein